MGIELSTGTQLLGVPFYSLKSSFHLGTKGASKDPRPFVLKRRSMVGFTKLPTRVAGAAHLDIYGDKGLEDS